MQKRKKFIILAAIFIIIAGLGGWYIYYDLTKKPSSVPAPIEGNNSNSGSGSAISENPSPNTDEIKKQMPDLDKGIVIKDDKLSAEEKNRAVLEIKKIVGILKEDYDRREDWLNLGIWRKMLGDYEGAKEAWEFVALIRPNDAVAFHNLGDLYAQNLDDFPKAEKYYLLAIEKSPETVFFYIKLHEFYRYFLKNPDLAEDILEKGVKATNDAGLKEFLEGYRKEIR